MASNGQAGTQREADGDTQLSAVALLKAFTSGRPPYSVAASERDLPPALRPPKPCTIQAQQPSNDTLNTQMRIQYLLSPMTERAQILA
ncbi:hypothetical protein J1614_006053 [Plenodomus biglobosus]|nr:hypothetical protein J1614_006053 [Plenodomus biglobosus]